MHTPTYRPIYAKGVNASACCSRQISVQAVGAQRSHGDSGVVGADVFVELFPLVCFSCMWWVIVYA